MTITDKTCLIMDEVDGMSAGDRGGVGALAALIRKTKVLCKLHMCFVDELTLIRSQSFALQMTEVHRNSNR